MNSRFTMYKDPENVKELIQDIYTKKTIRDVIDYVNIIFPKWIVSFIKEYSPKYPNLTKNWHELCENIGVKPKIIIIVDHMEFTKDHTLIQTFGELFTEAGFSVRDKTQFNICTKCKKAYPAQELHTILRTNGEKVPDVRGCC